MVETGNLKRKQRAHKMREVKDVDGRNVYLKVKKKKVKGKVVPVLN
jgi:hypothetical protein